jgi:hypothetical protein
MPTLEHPILRVSSRADLGRYVFFSFLEGEIDTIEPILPPLPQTASIALALL